MTVMDEAFLRDLYSARLLFEDKWAPAITFALYEGPLHYNEILSAVRSYRAMEGWSDKHNRLHDSVLTTTLKKMTAEGLLIRSEASDNFPPGVRYSLDPEAAKALAACQPIVEWLRAHRYFVTRAQVHRRTNNGEADGARSRNATNSSTSGKH